MINQIKIVLFFVTIFIIVQACKKNDSAPPPPSKMELLTANVWIYDSIYRNWGQANQILIYARDSSFNIVDYSQNKIKFYTDGTFNEILPNGYLRPTPDTWKMNSDSTVLLTSGGGYTNSAKIISLSSTKFVWVDTVNNVKGVNIPKY